MKQTPQEEQRLFCVFIDILGFGSLINDWERAKAFYEAVMVRLIRGIAISGDLIRGAVYDDTAQSSGGTASSSGLQSHTELELRWRILSDSIIATTPNAFTALQFATDIQSFCLGSSYLTRGGLAYGRHFEYSDIRNLLVVSEALRDAYVSESRMAKNPRVVIHPSALGPVRDAATFELSAHDETILTDHPNFQGFLAQSEDDLWFVSPFRFGVVVPPADRARELTALVDATPTEYRSKVLWLCDLHNYFELRGFIRMHFDEYFEAPDRFLASVQRLAATVPPVCENLVHTWRWTTALNRFFTPTLRRPWPAPHLYDNTFMDNMQLQARISQEQRGNS